MSAFWYTLVFLAAAGGLVAVFLWQVRVMLSALSEDRSDFASTLDSVLSSLAERHQREIALEKDRLDKEHDILLKQAAAEVAVEKAVNKADEKYADDYGLEAVDKDDDLRPWADE